MLRGGECQLFWRSKLELSMMYIKHTCYYLPSIQISQPEVGPWAYPEARTDQDRQ